MTDAGGAETDGPSEDERLRFMISERSSLGYTLTAATRRGLCALFMGDSPDDLVNDLQSEFPDASPVYDNRGLDGIGAQIFTLTENARTGLGVAIDMRGTRLQLRVWSVLRAIPIGEIETYSQIARKIGVPGASQAVARACLANRIALAIPCHRAIGDDGDIGEYRWGKERKRVLINFEDHLRRLMP